MTRFSGHKYNSQQAGDTGSFSHHHHHKKKCCPLVVDPLTLAALLGFIAAATAFLRIQITMILGRRKRRRRYLDTVVGPDLEVGAVMADIAWEGRGAQWRR